MADGDGTRSCGMSAIFSPTVSDDVILFQFETGNLAHFKSDRMRGIHLITCIEVMMSCIEVMMSYPLFSELDSTLGDTQCDIQGNQDDTLLPHTLPLSLPPFHSTDHETAIMHRLQEVILEHSTALLTVVELVAELDW